MFNHFDMIPEHDGDGQIDRHLVTA